MTSFSKAGMITKFVYDATGNRILKETPTGSTAYVRDGSGNVLSVYSQPAGGNFAQTEVHLYGSSRLGMATTQGTKDVTVPLSCGFDNGIQCTFTGGEKLFELSNHLGNVLATVTDKRIALPQTGIPAFIGHYEADIASAQDYYPFGMLQPGRKWNTGGYRFGFNGKENDNEVKGNGNQQDYGMRIYDPRLGRFLSVDPLVAKYPMLSPYWFVANNPIIYIDPDGRDIKPSKAFLNSPYGAIYQNLYKNNSAYLKIVNKYNTSKVFNLALNFGAREFLMVLTPGLQQIGKLMRLLLIHLLV